MPDLPQAVLFACTLNAIRSPMAAALMRHLAGKRVHVESVGVSPQTDNFEPDPLAAAAMAEIGLVLASHRPRRFEDLKDASFDLVITFSPEAQHKAVELTRYAATQVEYWPTPDPSMADGSREQRLAAYRALRDDLTRKLKARFLTSAASDT